MHMQTTDGCQTFDDAPTRTAWKERAEHAAEPEGGRGGAGGECKAWYLKANSFAGVADQVGSHHGEVARA